MTRRETGDPEPIRQVQLGGEDVPVDHGGEVRAPGQVALHIREGNPSRFSILGDQGDGLQLAFRESEMMAPEKGFVTNNGGNPAIFPRAGATDDCDLGKRVIGIDRPPGTEAEDVHLLGRERDVVDGLQERPLGRGELQV